MKFSNLPHPLRSRRQKRRPEMQRALLLAEAGARHDTDARGVEESRGVELVGGALFLLGLLDGAFGEGYSGEEVHGTLVEGRQSKSGLGWGRGWEAT